MSAWFLLPIVLLRPTAAFGTLTASCIMTLRHGLLRGIEIALEVKFGPDGLALLPALQEQTDLAFLERFAQNIKTTTNLDDLRRLLPTSGAS